VRASVSDYELIEPVNLDAALERVAEGWKPIAGGTDLMVLFQSGKLPEKRLVSIWKLGELRGVAESPGWVTIAALTTYTEIQRHSVLRGEYPLLCAAAGWTGSVANQNRGTLGGNIGNASPAADSPPALLVYGAELELMSVRGSRWVPYCDFHTGYKQSLLAADELIARIRLPRSGAPRRGYTRKVGARRAQAISKICFAGLVEGGKFRIAIASVAPTVIRCPRTEALLNAGAGLQEAKEMLMSEIDPIDDIRSTAAYRGRVTANLLGEFLRVVA
jgi:CO/xanthine dehydrogenase FAD-binding subunit